MPEALGAAPGTGRCSSRAWLAVCLVACVLADDGRPQHPLTDLPDASSAVDVRYVWPDHPDKRLPLNKLITIVGGFANSGNASLNITSVMGSVNSPFNFDHYLLNTSKLDVNIEVAPGTEQSFEYSFKLHPSVTTAKFRMAITVFYEDEEEAFATTFFNSTVAFYDVAEEGEAEGGGAGGSTFTWLLVLGIGGYVFITKFDGKQKLQDAGVLDALGIKLAGASDDFDTPTAAKKGKSKTKKQ